MSQVREELRSSKTAMANVFANPALRRIFLAFGVSLIGDGVFSLSAVVFVYRSGGATAVGVLAVVRYVAIASVAPFTSTLADQYDRRIIMVASDLVRLVLVALAATIVALHGSKWYVYALVVLVGLAGTAFRPSQASILPTLAKNHDEIAGANVVSSTIESVGFFAGPALAGFLLAFTNVSAAFSFDAATFVWSAIVVFSIHAPTDAERSPEIIELLRRAPDERDARAQSFLARAIQGFRLIGNDRNVLTLVVLYVLQCVVAGASAVFTVAIALKMLHIGSSGLGLMESLLGIGGLVGGFVALMLMERAQLAMDFALGVIVWAAPLVIIAVLPTLGAALLSMWLIGAANSVVDVNAITILQHIVPNDKLGRVLGALEGGEVAGMALGSLMMTVLIHWTGLRTGLALIGIAVTLAVLPGLPTMRRIDQTVFADGVKHRPPTTRHLHHLRWRHSH
ncbi:MAG: MFS transporter [Actinomycetales bacterium]|nr:MFS transporter [Actinomycetales bacterium]